MCNQAGPSFPSDATATSMAGAVSLDKVADLGASTGTAPANSNVDVSILVTPHNSLMALAMVWTKDDFNNTASVNMTLAGTMGGNDVYTGTIPGQAASTTVRFYFDGTPWSGNHVFNPGNNINYTYVTQ